MSLTAEEQQSLQSDLSYGTADKTAVVNRKPGMPIAGIDGNWQCRQCNNVNFASRETCNRCGGMGGNWTCGECGNLNYAHRLRCNRCDAPPPTAGGMGAGGMGAMGGMGMGMMGAQMGAQRSVDDVGRQYLMCFANENDPVQAAMSYLSMNAVNMMQRPAEYSAAGYGGYGTGYPQQGRGMYGMGAGNKRARGGPPKAGVDGNWVCKQCDNINFASRVECNRCKAPKEE